MPKNYYASASGDKKISVKRNRKKILINYHSIDSFENNPNAVICGYVDLKRKNNKHRESSSILFAEKTRISSVYEDRRSMKSIKGYINIGADNYIAIERKSPFILILPLLLIFLILLLISFFWSDSTIDKNPNFWTPTIEQNIGDIDTPHENNESQIKISGFSSWAIPAGKTENIPIKLSNPQGNPCYFSFTLILTEKNQVIYQSDMVPPGESIRQISISEPLSAGTYKAIIHIATNELDTGRKMNSADLNLTITAN